MEDIATGSPDEWLNIKRQPKPALRAGNYTEILIYIKTSQITEEEIVVELAPKHFGQAFCGLL